MPDPNAAPAAAPANAAPSNAAPAADPSKQQPAPAPAAAPAAAPQPAAEPKKEGAAAEPGAKPQEPPRGNQPPVELKKEDLKLPEGSSLDTKVVDEIIAFSKENGLSKEKAQALLDRESKMLSSYVDGEKAKLTQAQSSWTEVSRTDKEIGGEKFAENVECANRVFKTYGNEGLQKFLDDTKLGNHPDVLRFVSRIGRAMGVLDDHWVQPDGQASGAPQDAANALYGKTSQQK